MEQCIVGSRGLWSDIPSSPHRVHALNTHTLLSHPICTSILPVIHLLYLSILSFMHFCYYPVLHLLSHYLKPHIFWPLTMNAPSTPQAEGTCSLSWTVPCRMWPTCACWWRRQRSRQCAGPSWKREAASAPSSASSSLLWWGDRDGGVVKAIQGECWLSDSFTALNFHWEAT